MFELITDPPMTSWFDLSYSKLCRHLILGVAGAWQWIYLSVVLKHAHTSSFLSCSLNWRQCCIKRGIGRSVKNPAEGSAHGELLLLSKAFTAALIGYEMVCFDFAVGSLLYKPVLSSSKYPVLNKPPIEGQSLTFYECHQWCGAPAMRHLSGPSARDLSSMVQVSVPAKLPE